MTAFTPVRRRTGVIASEISRNRSAQMPVVRMMSSAGFGPVRPVETVKASQPSGTRARTKTSDLSSVRMTTGFRMHPPSAAPPGLRGALEGLLQVHACIHGSDLVAVAVEYPGARRREQLRKPPFASLTPSRVSHVGVDVRI